MQCISCKNYTQVYDYKSPAIFNGRFGFVCLNCTSIYSNAKHVYEDSFISEKVLEIYKIKILNKKFYDLRMKKNESYNELNSNHIIFDTSKLFDHFIFFFCSEKEKVSRFCLRENFITSAYLIGEFNVYYKSLKRKKEIIEEIIAVCICLRRIRYKREKKEINLNPYNFTVPKCILDIIFEYFLL